MEVKVITQQSGAATCGTGNIVIGCGTAVCGSGGGIVRVGPAIPCGTSTMFLNFYSTGVGALACAGFAATAVGYNAKAEQEGTAVGCCSRTYGCYSVAVGIDACARDAGAAIGHSTRAAYGSVAIGDYATATACDVTIGNHAMSSLCGASGCSGALITVGNCASNYNQWNSIAVGPYARNTDPLMPGAIVRSGNVAIGCGAKTVRSSSSISIGSGAHIGMASGACLLSERFSSMALGHDAVVTHSNSYNVGRCVMSEYDNSIRVYAHNPTNAVGVSMTLVAGTTIATSISPKSWSTDSRIVLAAHDVLNSRVVSVNIPFTEFVNHLKTVGVITDSDITVETKTRPTILY